MYIDVKEGNKLELLTYIGKFYKGGENFKMNADSIGKYIIMKMRSVTKTRVPILGIMTSESNYDPIIWGVFRLDWYDRALSPNNDYKTRLTPIGSKWFNLPERSWYNEDFESRVHCHEAIIVEDPIEAYEIAESLDKFDIDLKFEWIEYND